jgi:acetyltransferase-like isoleucine patch superfamily enzyme
VLHVTGRELLARSLRFFWFEPLFRSQCASIGANFEMEHIPYLHGSGTIVLGDDVTFGGMLTFIFGNRGATHPEVIIGDHTFLGHGTAFVVSSSVRVGNHCLLAGEVRISDYDGHPIDAARRRAGEPTPLDAIRPVVIGDDVWIGNNVIVLKGVHIGDRSIVGAGAVVTRDVPPDVVVAGNPARVVKQLVPTS